MSRKVMGTLADGWFRSAQAADLARQGINVMRFLLAFFLLTSTASAQVTFEVVNPPSITEALEAWKATLGAPWLWGATAIDYDGDGDSDIVCTNHNGGAVPSIILRNNFKETGQLTFTDVTATVFPSDRSKLFQENKPHVWDVTGDGKLDLVCGTRGQTLINQGGTFAYNGQQLRGWDWAIHEMGDFNGDGKTDFRTTVRSYSKTTLTTYLLGENGRFTGLSEQVVFPSDTPQVVKDRLAQSIAANDTATQRNRYSGPYYRVLDVDGDGNKDDLIAWFEGGYNTDRWCYVCLRQADRTLAVTPGLPTESVVPISAQDANGNGRVDLILTPGGVAKSGLWLQSADGTWGNVANPGIADFLKGHAPYTPHVWWEDFDKDGKPDLAISMMRYGRGRIWQNNGDGTFTEVASVSHWDADGMQVRSRGGYACDFNGDGKTDVLALGSSNHGSTTATILLNTSGTPDPIPEPGTVKVMIDGVTLPGARVTIDGVLVDPPETGERMIEIDTGEDPVPDPDPSLGHIPLPAHDPESQNFKRWYNNLGVGGQAWEQALAYRVTGDEKHRTAAIAKAENTVAADTVAGNQYLESGRAFQNVFTTLDWCNPTDEQRAEWLAWGKRHLGETDGSIKDSLWWSSRWSRNNPANNYYHSFMLATSCYAMAAQDEEWLTWVKTDRLPRMHAYYSTTPEGGSREGTGYGESHRRVFELVKLWRDYDGTDIVPQSFVDGSLHYWTHATTPGHGWVALIGDHTRTHGTTDMYHRHMIGAALEVASDPESISVGQWQLSNLPPITSPAFFSLELKDYPSNEAAPDNLDYHAKGAGHYFARTSWEDDATYIYCTAGRYDEAHQQQDQGAFAVFAGGRWKTCSDSPWTHGGIAQGVENQNVVRFGVPQKKSTSGTLAANYGETEIVVDMDLTEPAQNPWKRQVIYPLGSSRLIVRDWCDPNAEWGFEIPSEDDERGPKTSTATATFGRTDDGFISVVSW